MPASGDDGRPSLERAMLAFVEDAGWSAVESMKCGSDHLSQISIIILSLFILFLFFRVNYAHVCYAMDSCLILYVQTYYIHFGRSIIVTRVLCLYLFISFLHVSFYGIFAIYGITCLFDTTLARVFYHYSLFIMIMCICHCSCTCTPVFYLISNWIIY